MLRKKDRQRIIEVSAGSASIGVVSHRAKSELTAA